MNNIKQLIEKSRKTPALAPIYAMEVDRQLRSMGKAPLTFSAKGLADGDAEIDNALSIVELFDAQPTPQVGGAIYQAEKLVKDSKVSEAIAHAFTHAHGTEINALNLLYANYATSNPKLRIHFLNKYLSTYGLGIALQEGDGKEFFHQIKSAKTLERVDGPLVTVIMPAYNAEGTIELAVGSLLNQSWHNLQIIVVDDASTDSTLLKANDFAKRDPRVEVLSNPVNVGPYVCRNLGMLHTRGQWLTVHDADDWAFPDRIEQQVQALTAANALACTGRMLRMNERGQITRPTTAAAIDDDGYFRLCFVSLMVQTAYFRKQLGAWDSVRVGGDAEMIDRLTTLGMSAAHLSRPLMLCLDHDVGLTNHYQFGLADENGHTQPLRADYKQAYTAWHKTSVPRKFFAFGNNRLFEAPESNLVDQKSIKKVFATWTKNLELINATELFDADWYRGQYPEVEQVGLSAVEHYLINGKTGVYDPSPGFSSRFYLSTRSIKTNPLIHHLKGKDAGANPKQVLLGASLIAKTGAHELAITLAETHLSSELAYTANILKANAALLKCDEVGWQKHLNTYLSQFNVAPILLDESEGSVFNRLRTNSLPAVTDGPLITVIMPAWNSEKTVRKAAQSILTQTWRNLELLIVDDASTDNTWAVLQDISASDIRVKVARNTVNVGPYVSKNIALTKAQGDWITGHDADDWAHPQRLEQHIKFVLSQANPPLASLTHMLRITPNGIFNHLGKVGAFNLDGAARKASISCLFKRDFLVQRLGFWDTVRFGGDSELISRARLAEEVNYQELPLIGMICQDLETSLTNNPIYGVDKQNGAMLPRLDYGHAWKAWQAGLSPDNLKLEFPQYKQRSFPIPEEAVINLLDIIKNIDNSKFVTKTLNLLDVAIVTDLSFSGGNASSTIDEIDFFLAQGLSVTLIDCRSDRNIKAPISHRYESYKKIIQPIRDAKSVRAEVMILRHPSCITSKQLDLTGEVIICRSAFFVINNSCLLTDGSAAYVSIDLDRKIRAFPAAKKTLCPISDLIRDELLLSDDFKGINISDMNWHPTFDSFIYESHPKAKLEKPFVIGRHARDGTEKWLEDPLLLQKVYPSEEGFRISVLGGAKCAVEILGSLPSNWEVIAFGEETAKNYLQNLDAFVYFPHSGLVEAFGRTIVEAMLSCVPVIIPLRFRATFGDLPLYCEPNQVASVISRLSFDDFGRVAYLTEVQQIAKEKYANSAVARRLASTGLKMELDKANESAVRSLSVASSNYRASLLGLQLSEDAKP
jgi:glycosyltransferase involved in cell wall biosynthesis